MISTTNNLLKLIQATQKLNETLQQKFDSINDVRPDDEDSLTKQMCDKKDKKINKALEEELAEVLTLVGIVVHDLGLNQSRLESLSALKILTYVTESEDES